MVGQRRTPSIVDGFVGNLLAMTKLLTVFDTYDTEHEAVESSFGLPYR